MDKEQDMQAQRHLIGLASEAGFDVDNFKMNDILRALLKPISDDGKMDSGGGADYCDLWVTVGGVEYYITLRKSNAQLAKEGKPTPVQ